MFALCPTPGDHRRGACKCPAISLWRQVARLDRPSKQEPAHQTVSIKICPATRELGAELHCELELTRTNKQCSSVVADALILPHFRGHPVRSYDAPEGNHEESKKDLHA